MKNWQALSHALDLDIPEEQLARIAPSLDGLEAAFAPLRRGIAASVDPASIFNAANEEAQ